MDLYGKVSEGALGARGPAPPDLSVCVCVTVCARVAVCERACLCACVCTRASVYGV